MQGQQGTYIYQVTNNTLYIKQYWRYEFAQGVSVLSPADASSLCGAQPELCQYCDFPLQLTKYNSCLIKIAIDSNRTNSLVKGGPILCYLIDHPIYCSQPLYADQLSTQITPGPVSSDCQDNIDNFNYELATPFDSATHYDPHWGPARNPFPLSPGNPDLTTCVSSVSWQRARVLAAAKLWIDQKLNYCEHHVPDYPTPLSQRGNVYGYGGYCNPIVDIAPNTYYYQQQARWNYSGTGSETAQNWVQNNAMWYGFDCSNYTAFLYDFALNIIFNADIQKQSGQIDQSSSAGPNNGGAQTIPGTTSGPLVCVDGTTEESAPLTCTPGNFISPIDSRAPIILMG